MMPFLPCFEIFHENENFGSKTENFLSKMTIFDESRLIFEILISALAGLRIDRLEKFHWIGTCIIISVSPVLSQYYFVTQKS